MKRFLIHVSTYWCGMDNTFRAEAESELELYEIADQLAYDNFQSYGCEADIAEEEGYDPDEMEDSDWDKLWETVDESQYYSFTIEEFEGDDEEWEEYGGEIYGKDTRKLNDLLSQFLSLRNEVSEIADKTADAVFDSVESRDITKGEALTILTDNKLLPVANWICLPDFMDDYDYFSRYSTIYYMDYMYPRNFGNHEYASWSEMSYEEGINELYDFVKENRVIGCIYDW